MSKASRKATVRLGVLDIGSNTVHLAIVDLEDGARPAPAHSRSESLRLMRFVGDDGAISEEGIEKLEACVRWAREESNEHAVDELLVMATSAMRDATNGDEVLKRVEDLAGASVQILSGADEARLTFLAVRRWHGWVAGRILVLDIGGGSLEIAIGNDEVPDLAFSVPLGAARMTSDFIHSDPPTKKEFKALRQHVRHTLWAPSWQALNVDPPDYVVATSKNFRSLARLAGMPVDSVGPDDRWRLREDRLQDWSKRLRKIPTEQRDKLPGVTPERSYQIVAGAVVAREAMRALNVAELEICPWALREGVLLQRMDELTQRPEF